MDDPQRTLQELVDRAAISDTVNRYAIAIDLRDWDLLRSCFTDEIEVQFDWWEVRGPRTTSADEFIDGVKSLSGFQATQHLSSNHAIEITGDSARCLSYAVAKHYLPNSEGENAYTIGGYYENELVRTAGVWKIRRTKLNVTWSEGNRHVFDLAIKAYSEQQSKGEPGGPA